MREILPFLDSTWQGQNAPFGACLVAVFSGKLPSMETEIDDKLPSNSS